MNIPGFDAELSLGPTMGGYRGNGVSGRLGAAKGRLRPPLSGTMHPALELGSVTRVSQGPVSTIQPALERYSQCTTVYSGYVTYPQRVCQSPFNPPVANAGFSDPGDGTGASEAMSRQVQVSRVPMIGKVPVGPLSRFCRTHYGPWFAQVVKQESCDFRQPDEFTLTISGAPQPVELRWTGTMQDAPATVGAIGNVFPNVPTCSCCGGRKQCPDGSCVPPSSPCGPGSPA